MSKGDNTTANQAKSSDKVQVTFTSKRLKRLNRSLNLARVALMYVDTDAKFLKFQKTNLKEITTAIRDLRDMIQINSEVGNA